MNFFHDEFVIEEADDEVWPDFHLHRPKNYRFPLTRVQKCANIGTSVQASPWDAVAKPST